uniref:Secreted protein n=1 Tax=Glossina palpalis gambiensis TaxID=67801 RepID=A0A1B0AMG6_9MUSC
MFNKLFTSVLFLWIIVCLCYQAVDALVPTPDLPLDVANKLQKCASEAVKSVCGAKGNVSLMQTSIELMLQCLLVNLKYEQPSNLVLMCLCGNNSTYNNKIYVHGRLRDGSAITTVLSGDNLN